MSDRIDHYLNKLATVDDAQTCATLLNGLVEEENKFAANREELGKAARRVADGKLRVENLKRRAEAALENGLEPDTAIALLVTMQETQRVLEDYYQNLCRKLGTAGLQPRANDVRRQT